MKDSAYKPSVPHQNNWEAASSRFGVYIHTYTHILRDNPLYLLDIGTWRNTQKPFFLVCSAWIPLPKGEKPVTPAFEDHDIQHFFLSLPVAGVSGFDCSHHRGEWPLQLAGPVWSSGLNTVEHDFFCLFNPNSNIVWKSLFEWQTWLNYTFNLRYFFTIICCIYTF